MKTVSILALLPLGAAGALADAVSFSSVGGTYVQNFDGLSKGGTGLVVNQEVFPDSSVKVPFSGAVDLPNTGVEGWYFRNDRGSATTTEYRVHNGSLSGSTGRGVVSFGDNYADERALGILPTSNQIPSFALFLRNDTGASLNSVTIGFTGEQWRVGAIGLSSTLGFSYRTYSDFASTQVGYTGLGYTAEPSLDFNTVFSGTDVLNNSALNGNLPQYQTNLSSSIAVNWAPGEILALQWSGFDLQGQDHGLAIDNLTVSAIPEPSTYALALGGLALGFAALRRRFQTV